VASTKGSYEHDDEFNLGGAGAGRGDIVHRRPLAHRVGSSINPARNRWKLARHEALVVESRQEEGAMKRIFLTVLGVALLPLSAVASSVMDPASDKAQIVALEKKYNDGFNARDVGAIVSCYAPGDKLFVFDVIPPREYPSWDAYKKDWEGLFAAFPGPVSNQISEQTITVVGAVAYGHSIQTGTFTRKNGTKLTVVARTTDIYRKIDGKWLIVEEHNSIPVDVDTMKPDPLSKM
jgi:ketosteroid isomerase-like protein